MAKKKPFVVCISYQNGIIGVFYGISMACVCNVLCVDRKSIAFIFVVYWFSLSNTLFMSTAHFKRHRANRVDVLLRDVV